MSDQAASNVVSGMALWGFVSGVVALFCWRFVAPPNYGDFVVLGDDLANNQFTVSVFDASFIPLVPAVVTFPLVGVVIGAVAGFAVQRFDRLRKDITWRTTPVGSLLLGAVLGGVTGAVSAAALQWSPPSIMVRDSMGGPSGMPAQVDFPAMWVTMPVVGVAVGVLVSLAIRRIGVSLDAGADR